MSGLQAKARHYSNLTAPNLQPTANQERNDQRGNKHYSRELLMMGIVVPETCSADKKNNKIISSINFLLFFSLHISCSTFSFAENCAVYEILWKNFVQPGRPQMTVWSTRIACWITKATDTNSNNVTLIACPLQQWLQECASMLL